jgi:5-methylcytosine-specific restriction endonuclease McrA
MGTRNYRTRKKGNGGSFTLEQWANLKVFYGNLCLGCGRGELVLLKKGLQLVPDHILPVVLGGSSDISNIQPLCHGKGGCNLHKGAKYIDYRRKENVGVQ